MRKWLWAWLLAEMVLYAIFLVGDLQGAPHDEIKLLAVSLCVVMAAVSQDLLVTAALLLSAFADVFLLFYAANDQGLALLGVLLFCMAQTVYALRIGGLEGWRLLAFAVLIGAWLVSPQLTRSVPGTLYGAAAYYIVMLAFNTALAMHRRMPWTAQGLLLLLLCDICVGIHYVRPRMALAAFGMWLFYLPGQVCMVLGAWRPQAEKRRAAAWTKSARYGRIGQ